MSLTYPAIMRRSGFEAFVLALPGTELVRQWGDASVAKIGGKIYALLDGNPGEVWLKVSETAYELLTELEGIRPAPYFAQAGWVAIAVTSPLRGDEVEAYLREAHRLIAGKLTRKVRAELGLA